MTSAPHPLLRKWKQDNLEAICANSYRDFHATGLDYLCLRRSEDLTVKAYFFDGDLSRLPEIVTPHDHRYDFTTLVLSGEIANRTYIRMGHDDMRAPKDLGAPQRLQRFKYMTPLNGGNGFEWDTEDTLYPCPDAVFGPMRSYCTDHTTPHTLSIRKEGTVALLFQMHDCVPLEDPTHAWKPDKAAPCLDGLYSRMGPDHAQMRLAHLQQLLGGS